jgi:EAL domain-containing protein (putative c-di-GMP-specific phosphodiesterase class I)
VFEKACIQAGVWRRAGLELFMSVNLSARQLADQRLASRLAEIMIRTEMVPAELSLEITETALVEDLGQARKGLREIHELGVNVSIDDFGTGWASLTYLREFPVHALKVDCLFVDGLSDRPRDLAIVKSIIGIGRELGLDVIAEGIETLDQRALLYQLGCERGQGYLFGRPVPAEELFVREQPSRRLPAESRVNRGEPALREVVCSPELHDPFGAPVPTAGASELSVGLAPAMNALATTR